MRVLGSMEFRFICGGAALDLRGQAWLWLAVLRIPWSL